MKAAEQLIGFPALTVIPILGFAIDVVTHLILSRLPFPSGSVHKQFVSFAIGFASTIAMLLLTLLPIAIDPLDIAAYLLLQMLIYAFFAFWLFNLLNLNVSSLRIRIIKELYRQHPKPVPDAVLRAIYGMSEILDARLLRLERGKQLYRSHDRYFLRRGLVLHIAHFFSSLRSLLFGRLA